MASIRVDLTAPLAGHWIALDDDALTMGTIEDMQSDKIGLILDAMATVIVGGDLPRGQDKAGLRRLRPMEFKAVADAFRVALEVPKAG
jgi:hypothetical protein